MDQSITPQHPFRILAAASDPNDRRITPSQLHPLGDTADVVLANDVVFNTEPSLQFGSDIHSTFNSASKLDLIKAPNPAAIAPLDPQTFHQILHMGTHDPEGFLVTTVDCYLSEARQLLEFIHLAVRERDPVKLGHSAHMLKSSSAFLGALDFAQMCQALENLERSQSPTEADWEQAAQQIEQLEQAYFGVEEALQIERQKYQ